MPAILRLTVEKAEPLLRGQDHYWRVMRVLDGGEGRPFTASEVRATTDDATTAPVRAFLARLVSGGIAVVDGTAAGLLGRKERTYRLLARPEDTPLVSRDGARHRPSTGQQQMWNVMRGPAGKHGFTADDLAAYGSTDDITVPKATAKTFIQNLARGGYLVQLDPGGPGRLARWRLKGSRNTGPKPPLVLTAKVIFDQNRARVMGDVVAEEVAP